MVPEPAPCGSSLTDDGFLGGALTILQPKTGYRAGIDAALLAAAVPATAFRVLDAGAGVGTAGLCVARRLAHARVVLLEREPALARLARENARRNNLADRVEVIEGDLRNGAAMRGLTEGYDAAIANPPFHDTSAGTPSADPLKAAAHAMDEADIETWCRFLARVTKPGGRVCLIHKAEALPVLLAALDRRFGALRILPIHARAAEPAIRILVGGTKGSRAPLALLPPFVLQSEGSAFTAAADDVLRRGAALRV